ncbi:MAG: hypothetical protein J0M30_08965 [Chitinophagales bacterium]|nr:hypothetical protein [Chitinophagales bacterium]
MKKMILALWGFTICFSFSVDAQVKWDGNSDGDGDNLSWNDPFNWQHDQVPLPTDDVLLDHSLLSINFEVRLPDGNVLVTLSHLQIKPSSGKSIQLTLPLTNTANPAFLATGSGDALVLDSGAVFLNASGASSGTPVMVSADNFFRINNGGKYIHRTPRGHTNNFVTRLSTQPGTEKGIFSFDVPGTPGTSYVLSGSGRTFGSLYLMGMAAGGNKTYVSSGVNRLSIRGDFRLLNGADYTHNIQNQLGVEGLLFVDTGSVLNLSSGSYPTELLTGGPVHIKGNIVETGSGKPGILFKGAQWQMVRMDPGAAFLGDSLWMRVDNPQGIELESPLTVPYQFIFSNGQVNAGPSSPLVFPLVAHWVGAGPGSHVNGPVLKEGNIDFVFPIGEGGFYAPVKVRATAEGMETDHWEISYHRQDPRQMEAAVLDPDLSHISQVEYWRVNSTEEAAPRQMEIMVGEMSFANDAPTLRVAYNNGEGSWQNMGQGAFETISNNPLTGMLATASPVEKGGFLTLASSESQPVNPLPLHFVHCELKEEKNGWRLNWRMGDIPGLTDRFEIERSLNGEDFSPIASLPATQQSHHTWVDSSLVADDHLSGEVDINPVLAYRIRLREGSGKTELSPVIRTRIWLNQKPTARLFPNPVNDRATLDIIGEEKERVLIQVLDLAGRIRLQWPFVLGKGKNRCPVQLGKLEKGHFWMRICSANKTYPVIPFQNR